MSDTRITCPIPDKYPLPTSPEVFLSLDTVQRRNELLADIQSLLPVTDAASQKAVVEVTREAKKWIKGIEEERKKIKAPVLAVGKRIDEVAEEATEKLSEEIKNRESQVAMFQSMEQRRVAQEEAQRLEAIRRAQAETDRLAKEAAEAKAKLATTDDDAHLSALLAAARASEEAQEAEAAAVQAPEAEVNRVKGITMRKELCHEVTDIAALWQHRPDLCVPPSLSVSKLKATIFPGLEDSVPGVRIWFKDVAVLR